MPPPISCSVLTAGPASQHLWEFYTGCRSSTASPSKSQLWCTKLFIVAVQRTWLTPSRSAQPTLIGSSDPLRPQQPRYRELGPSSENRLSLSAFFRDVRGLCWVSRPFQAFKNWKNKGFSRISGHLGYDIASVEYTAWFIRFDSRHLMPLIKTMSPMTGYHKRTSQCHSNLELLLLLCPTR